MPDAEIPAGAICYRELGPWKADQVPTGLQKRHNVKEGCWVKLQVLDGQILFIWDDSDNETRDTETLLSAGEHIIIPPIRPHHLELNWDTEIKLDFYRVE
ncbi:DUF1971 domain-containing protein [Sphingorhabdus arenilitoris]|uniref:DUF1971 domain-containing protein n=1 Tax=Sphingorhabdus arenilitoris TaxID=1490041 RepID=A0ABV8REK9_9SPHN